MQGKNFFFHTTFKVIKTELVIIISKRQNIEINPDNHFLHL